MCAVTALTLSLCLPFTVMAAESDSAAKYLIKEVPNPKCDSVGGEWTIVALSNYSCDVPENYYDIYYRNLESIVKEKKGILDEDRYTEYSRVVIALSSIGKSALNVAGYNLAEPLKDYDKVTAQGLNGAVYALIALDRGEYIGPRKQLRSFILSKELADGGWNFMGKGEADPDMTAMAVQALSKYRFLKDVHDTIERAMPIINKSDYESSETVSQIILAMDSIKQEPDLKLVNKLLEFQMKDGGFKHSKDDDEGNVMSTEQALIALSVVEKSNRKSR